jgi:hypothetical protein
MVVFAGILTGGRNVRGIRSPSGAGPSKIAEAFIA